MQGSKPAFSNFPSDNYAQIITQLHNVWGTAPGLLQGQEQGQDVGHNLNQE
jgi:hypothetical protein